MTRRCGGALLMFCWSYAPAASAWNDTGHMIAALIAYDRMPSYGARTDGAVAARASALSGRFRAASAESVAQRGRGRAGSLVLRVCVDVARCRAPFRQRARRVGARCTGRALQPRHAGTTSTCRRMLQPSDRRRIDAPTPSMSVGRSRRSAHERRAGARRADAELVQRIRRASARSRCRGSRT